MSKLSTLREENECLRAENARLRKTNAVGKLRDEVCTLFNRIQSAHRDEMLSNSGLKALRNDLIKPTTEPLEQVTFSADDLAKDLAAINACMQDWIKSSDVLRWEKAVLAAKIEAYENAARSRRPSMGEWCVRY